MNRPWALLVLGLLCAGGAARNAIAEEAAKARQERDRAKTQQQLQEAEPYVSQLSAACQPAVKEALRAAGENRAELIGAIKETDVEQREAMAFLIANMPPHDLKSLKKHFLLENVKYACLAREKAPWSKDLKHEQLFFNYILPYANLNERRDNWRKDFYDRFSEAAWECKSTSEAAKLLNRKVFETLDVRYHATKRPKPDQSPYESTEAKFASCTGLSILLVDACRAVGIPARVVGTPLWTDKSGNHTWVEIWDGRWHYVGAAEPSELNRGWFTGRAAKADPNNWLHCIYAASFQKTQSHYPLVWDMSIRWVPAVDVTRFYMSRSKVKVELPDAVEADAAVLKDGVIVATESGSGEVEFELGAGDHYDLEIRTPDGKVRRTRILAPERQHKAAAKDK